MGIGRKLFDEIDKPIGYKKVYQNSYGLESEASWNGIIKGYNGFPDGKTVGSGNSFEGKNRVIISNWEGVFTTNDGEQLTFKGRDMNKMGKFVVLRTYSTNSKKLSWINGLVCLLEGTFNENKKEFSSIGYEWIFLI
ncbi:MAG TPA: hypothetical protein VFR65_00360 [Nitrososphaeraceae archaeon]|jgi:hypothetical protein|nr:hypothetical protein [Nitrososphaeraceae archaeon]